MIWIGCYNKRIIKKKNRIDISNYIFAPVETLAEISSAVVCDIACKYLTGLQKPLNNYLIIIILGPYLRFRV